MFRYATKRMALAILTLFIILIFAYVMIVSFIQNPYEKAAVGATDPKQREELFKAAATFNSTSTIEKLWIYFTDFFQGDFGKIYIIHIPGNNIKNIPDLFFKPLKYSVGISMPSFIISAIFGVLLGIWAGYKRGRLTDTLINIFISIFIAIPSFIIAPFFIDMFRKLGFPMRFKNANELGSSVALMIKSIIPPILVITLGSLAIYTLYSRNQVVSVLTSNYVLIAKTKGLSGSQIFWKYVFRNISIPLAAIIIPSYIGLLSGSIIIEKFWSVPGTSTIIAQAFPNGEINVVMFSIFFFSALGLGTEVFVDISYAIIDPRIKYDKNLGIDYAKAFKSYIERRNQLKDTTKMKGVK